MSEFTLIHDIPTVETYCALREAAGLSAKSAEAAALGLPNSLFAVQVRHGTTTVGMGRVIGDGGCFFQITDVAVLPAYQGQGLGRRIVSALMDYLRAEAPPSAYVSLIADGDAQHLYAKFGFQPTAPRSEGMWWQPEGAVR